MIRAGPSGLAAAKSLLDAGLEVTVFECQTGVGGNWRFSEQVGHSSVFETTYMQLLRYFTGYAERFGLLPHAQLEQPDVPQLDTPRHTITVDDALFRARLKAQLPADFVSLEPIRTS